MQSFAGGVDPSAVDADVTGNGAAESSASSVVPPVPVQSAWLSKSCQTWSDVVGHIRTPSNTVRHLQAMSAFLWAQLLNVWWCILMYSADVMWCTVMNVLQALRSFQMCSLIIHIPSRHSFFKGWPRDSASVLYPLLPSHVEPLNFRWVSSNLFDSRCVEFAGNAFGTFGCGICAATSAGDKHCRRAPCEFCFGFCSVFFCRSENRHWRPECQTRVGRSGDPIVVTLVEIEEQAWNVQNDVEWRRWLWVDWKFGSDCLLHETNQKTLGHVRTPFEQVSGWHVTFMSQMSHLQILHDTCQRQEVSMPVLMEMSLAMGQQKAVPHQ